MNNTKRNSYWQELIDKCRIYEYSQEYVYLSIKDRVKTMRVKVYNKLIRDKIPQIIAQSGKQAIIEEVSGKIYLELLNSKLGEELQEYLDSQSIEELADLVEVVYAILDDKNISIQEFEVIRKQKVMERGAFKEKLLLKEVIDG